MTFIAKPWAPALDAARLHLGEAISSLQPPSPRGPTQAAEDIRPIHGPVPIPEGFHWEPWLVSAALVLAALGAAFIVFRLVKARRRSLTPRARALLGLAAAEERIGAVSPRTCSILVSDTVRHFIQERFGLPITRETSEEFLQRLRVGGPAALATEERALEDFLARIDFLKFSGWQADAEVLRELLAAARHFVTAVPERDEETAEEPQGWSLARILPARTARKQMES